MTKTTWQKAAVQTLGTWLSIVLIGTPPPAFGNTKEIQLFSYVEEATSEDGLGIPVRTSEQLKLARPGDTLVFQDARKHYRILIDQREKHQNGDVSLLGKIANTDLLTTITRGETGASGRIRTHAGDYTIRQYHGEERLFTPKHNNQLTHLHGDDTSIPPHRHNTAAAKRVSSAALSSHGFVRTAAEQSIERSTTGTDLAVVTVAVLWDQAFENTQGSTAAARTEINRLVAYSNRVFEDSDIYIKLRLAHSQRWQPTGYLSTQTASYVLHNIITDQDNNFTAHSDISTLQDEHLVDTVVFIRQLSSSHTTCGFSFTNTTSEHIKNFPFSVVHSGRIGNKVCRDSSFPHEIGHNFGSRHDHSNTTKMGYFPYSHGHDTNCIPSSSNNFNCSATSHFATVMSVDTPRIDKFSNPRIKCLGDHACGVAEGNENAADNARGFNTVRFIVEQNRRLSAPTSVITSKGTHATFVHLTWDTVVGASDYRILRATSMDGGFAVVTNTQAQTYNDVSAPHGQTLYYKLQACIDGYECSIESAPARGYRQPFQIRDRSAARNTISETAATNTTVSGLALELIDTETSRNIDADTWTINSHTDVFFLSTTGKLELIRAALDYETTASYTIQVSAIGRKGTITHTTTLTVTIHLQDVFESLDVSDRNPATNTISEYARVGASVSGLRLQALDEGMNRLPAEWQVTTPSDIFSIHGGILTLAKTGLDSETTPTYIVAISAAAQKAGRTLTATHLVTVQVNNVKPLWLRLRLFLEGPLQ